MSKNRKRKRRRPGTRGQTSQSAILKSIGDYQRRRRKSRSAAEPSFFDR